MGNFCQSEGKNLKMYRKPLYSSQKQNTKDHKKYKYGKILQTPIKYDYHIKSCVAYNYLHCFTYHFHIENLHQSMSSFYNSFHIALQMENASRVQLCSLFRLL